MIKGYPYNLVSFGVYFYPAKKSLSGVLFKKIGARFKEIIVKQYNGRMDFPELSDEYSQTWYNLVIDTKGITNDSIINEILNIVDEQKYNIAEIIGDSKYNSLKAIEQDIKFSGEYRFSYTEFLTIITSDITMVKLDVSHFLKQRRAYPGSAFLRIYLENALSSIIRRFTNKALIHKISANKFIRSLTAIERVYSHVLENLRKFKSNAMKYSTQSVIYEKLNRDISKLYDFVLLVYDPDVDHEVLYNIKEKVKKGKYDDALTIISREYKKCITEISSITEDNNEKYKLYGKCYKFIKYMTFVYYIYKLYYKNMKSDIIELYLNTNAHNIFKTKFKNKKFVNYETDDQVKMFDDKLNIVTEKMVKEVLTNRKPAKSNFGKIFTYKLSL